MIWLIKLIISPKLRVLLRTGEKKLIYWYRRQVIRIPVSRSKTMKIIVGAAKTKQSGWYSTNEQWLDITNSSDWKQLFGNQVLLTNVLAEHVFEHLTPTETNNALQLIRKHMLKGGVLRIAVPDRYNSNLEYQKNVCIGGIGADASDHKQFFGFNDLSDALRLAGFKPKMQEGYLSNGKLIQNQLDDANGFVMRSRSNPNLKKSSNSGWDFTDSNTSLIIDGILDGK